MTVIRRDGVESRFSPDVVRLAVHHTALGGEQCSGDVGGCGHGGDLHGEQPYGVTPSFVSYEGLSRLADCPRGLGQNIEEAAPGAGSRDRLGVAELISGLGQEQLRHPRCRRAQRCARAAVVHHDVDLAEDLVLWHEAIPRTRGGRPPNALTSRSGPTATKTSSVSWASSAMTRRNTSTRPSTTVPSVTYARVRARSGPVWFGPFQRRPADPLAPRDRSDCESVWDATDCAAAEERGHRVEIAIGEPSEPSSLVDALKGRWDATEAEHDGRNAALLGRGSCADVERLVDHEVGARHGIAHRGLTSSAMTSPNMVMTTSTGRPARSSG